LSGIHEIATVPSRRLFSSRRPRCQSCEADLFEEWCTYYRKIGDRAIMGRYHLCLAG
jgi:hypothetical protein